MLKTRLNEAHHRLKGKMIDFFGWELPVLYSGLNQEHNAVRQSGGLFDVSHMGEIFFSGSDALAAIQHITSNNAAKLVPGKIQYSGLLTETGCFVDDLLVYMLAENSYMLVVNAANVDKDFHWMVEKTATFDVQIENLSQDFSQIAIQGPKAQDLLSEFTGEDLAAIKYYHFRSGKVNGHDALISRTGYTGEDGFEIYMTAPASVVSPLFLDLVGRGADLGILPTGLGARDTLRLEAKMALYGNDIDAEHTVLEADLGWILKLKKGDFIGRDALLRQKENGISRKLVGFELVDRGIARHGYPVIIDGSQYGEVTSGTYAPFLKKAIGLAYLPVELAVEGTLFEVEIRAKRISARVVKTPFYKKDG